MPSRSRLWLEIAAVDAALEGALWTEGPARALWAGAAIVLIIAFTLTGGRNWTTLGLDPRRLRYGWWIAPAGLGAALLILFLGHAAGSSTLTIALRGRPLSWLALQYPLWALIQEFIAQGFFYVRFEALLGGRTAVAATAVLFALAHLPNPVLVPVTLVGGWALSELFRRYRTIYVLAVAHILVALSLSVTIPNHLVHHMRVGRGYSRAASSHVLP